MSVLKFPITDKTKISKMSNWKTHTEHKFFSINQPELPNDLDFFATKYFMNLFRRFDILKATNFHSYAQFLSRPVHYSDTIITFIPNFHNVWILRLLFRANPSFNSPFCRSLQMVFPSRYSGWILGLISYLMKIQKYTHFDDDFFQILPWEKSAPKQQILSWVSI